ncbi:hypothetical protein AB1399_09805 [Hydrogenibacillus schlegelii]|uniref:Uncharacterized protein n=1 Tax=Hydrogenibacillus schlegelii TaxID=1484 RepID=A0A132MZF0_HYDSH|nr:hypothetical protein [Hydrogenibacillus schlegelii]KWX03278.1 hypothetical protein TR75_08835 [Hydrogenibacillus schlegelii]OAR04369.1 hypothetical protein SA87_12200 [Hydrogenibacillus schlegelii]
MRKLLPFLIAADFTHLLARPDNAGGLRHAPPLLSSSARLLYHCGGGVGMFATILKGLLIVFLGSMVLVALALILGVSTIGGFVMGYFINALFGIPKWLSVSFFSIFFFIYFSGTLLGKWEVRRRPWASTLAALWLLGAIADRLPDAEDPFNSCN